MNRETLRSMGLQVNERGQVIGIDLPVSSNDLFASGYHRRVRLKRLTFEADLEMLVVFERYIVDSEGNDVYTLVHADPALSATAKRERLICLQSVEIAKTTKDAYRNPKTGLLVNASENGAVTELFFFQNLALAHLKAQGLALTGSEPYMFVVYLMLANIIREIDVRGEL